MASGLNVTTRAAAAAASVPETVTLPGSLTTTTLPAPVDNRMALRPADADNISAPVDVEMELRGAETSTRSSSEDTVMDSDNGCSAADITVQNKTGGIGHNVEDDLGKCTENGPENNSADLLLSTDFTSGNSPCHVSDRGSVAEPLVVEGLKSNKRTNFAETDASTTKTNYFAPPVVVMENVKPVDNYDYAANSSDSKSWKNKSALVPYDGAKSNATFNAGRGGVQHYSQHITKYQSHDGILKTLASNDGGIQSPTYEDARQWCQSALSSQLSRYRAEFRELEKRTLESSEVVKNEHQQEIQTLKLLYDARLRTETESQYAELESSVTTLSERINTLKADLRAEKSNNKELLSRYTELKNHFNDLIQEIQCLTQSRRQYQQRKDELELKYANLVQRLNEQQIPSAVEIALLKSQLKQAEDSNALLYQQKLDITRDMVEAQRFTSTLRDSNNTRTEQIRQLEQKCRYLEAQNGLPEMQHLRQSSQL